MLGELNDPRVYAMVLFMCELHIYLYFYLSNAYAAPVPLSSILDRQYRKR